MEPTQTDPERTQRRNDRELVSQVRPGAPLGLSYFSPREFEAHRAEYSDTMLGAVAFGAQRPRVAATGCPYAWVDMPVLNGDSMFEVWTCSQPVVREDHGEFLSARNEDVLFGCLQTTLDRRLDAASYFAYTRIFDFIDSRGYGQLLRVWNYFPHINAEADGLECYMRFNVGRHEAFVAKGRMIATDTPAACALGSRGEHLVIYFLAAKQRGQRVENPRQTSPFAYPPQYGPRSPNFARAMLIQNSGKPLLFVSGTASIVGHQTLHAGNARAQARETVANILALTAQAQLAGFDCSSSNTDRLLKAYLRHPHDLAMVQDCLNDAFGPATKALYLQADICRSDLLVEVEAVYLDVSAPADSSSG